MTSLSISPKSRDDLGALRRECGQWLKDKREAAGLSQREIAAKVGSNITPLFRRSKLDAVAFHRSATRPMLWALALIRVNSQ